MAPGSFAPVTGYRSGGPHRLNPGEFTDDTSLALALADSIAKVGWDLNDQADRYVQWMKHGKYSVNGRCFDIGITTSSALHRFMENKDAALSGSRVGIGQRQWLHHAFGSGADPLSWPITRTTSPNWRGWRKNRA